MLWSVPHTEAALCTTLDLVLLVLLSQLLNLVSVHETPVVCSPLTECCVGCPPEHLHPPGAGASGERSCSTLPGGGGEGQSVATGTSWSATRRTVSHSSEGVRDGCEGVRS